jgi:choline monooxygenase
LSTATAAFMVRIPGSVSSAVNILPNRLFIIDARPVAPGSHRRPLPAHASGDGRLGRRRWGGRRDRQVLGRRQPRGHQDRRTRPSGPRHHPVPGGRPCYRFEESLHRFQNMIVDRMVGKRRVPAGDAGETVPMFTSAAARANGAAGD